jgi:hypothetical protein
MKYVVEMVSGVAIYIPSFRRSEVFWGYTHTSTQQDVLISPLLVFQDKERRLVNQSK